MRLFAVPISALLLTLTSSVALAVPVPNPDEVMVSIEQTTVIVENLHPPNEAIGSTGAGEGHTEQAHSQGTHGLSEGHLDKRRIHASDVLHFFTSLF
ncbi:hypothetical protein FRC19_010871 [Serendipita sp. 401]|nr:hypothetical protein FRC19_010871 [Serendipita sp. 401]KAG8834232.1 hypothetical protein FRC18_002328 [Serendipita sp. 400]KAG9022892.1 hypothetical protein FS842_005889 [Serendipita sp. 407]